LLWRSGAFSGAAKKKYLKQRKANRAAADSSSDNDSDSDSKATAPQQHAQHSRSRHRQQSEDVTAPLQYRPLVAVPAAPFSMRHDASSTPDDDAVAYMPKLDASEVGWTPEGFELDMPTRPQWQVCACVLSSCG
jgi:hypothetical protein